MISKLIHSTFLGAVMMAAVTQAVADDQAKKEDREKTPAALAFKMKSLDGKEVDLSKYQGKVVMVVNVASKCGLTPQYKQLQALHEKYSKDGLAILGFPCNQFGKQEPGSPDEIRDFCAKNYGVKFDIFEKVDVNGDSACALYKHLRGLKTKPKEDGDISWNFEKFLINRKGEVVARFEPKTAPDSEEIVKLLKAAIEEKVEAKPEK